MPGTGVMSYCFRLRFLPLAIFICSPPVIRGQLCGGSKGDPVVNINFGQGATGSGPLYVPSHNYAYTGSSCPDDGYYTITNRTSGCFNNTWHTVLSDRTGEGNFMLINAALSAGDFFLTTVTDLCPSTTYEFSAWMMNVVKVFNAIRPEIIFRIEKPDGTILAFYESGQLPVTTDPQWKQYGFVFTTPPDNGPVVLRITDTWPGGYGNDFALDDIILRPCGPQITATIQGHRDTLDICEGDDSLYTFSANSSAYQLPVYQWQLSSDSGSTWHDIAGATANSYLHQPELHAGSYWYRVTVADASVSTLAACRIASNPLVINMHAKPIADAGPDRVYLQGFPVTLSAVATGENVTFSWTPPLYMRDASSLHPTVSPPFDIVYRLSVISSSGCTMDDSVQVKFAPGIFVPNAFTPNGDGVNDYWQIPFLDQGMDAEVNVFNRWGELVYHSSGGRVSWDGQLNGNPQPTGAYVYVIVFRMSDFPVMRGVLTLIR